MSVFDAIGSILKPVTNLIDDIHTSPEEKLTLKNELKRIELKSYEVVMDYESKLIDAQSKIVLGEVQGESWLQRNWRPLLMLTFIAIVANNYILAPYLQAAFGWAVVLDLPDKIWTAITVGMGGYIVGRSGEKIVKEIQAKKG